MHNKLKKNHLSDIKKLKEALSVGFEPTSDYVTLT